MNTVMTAQLKPCEVCGAELTYGGKGRKPRYCEEHRANGHGSRSKKQKTYEFIGVDSEGVRRGARLVDGQLRGGHLNMVLVSAGDQSLWSADDDTPLELNEVLTFLWDQFLAHRDAVFVGFSLGFDFAQWLKWLPRDKAWSLCTNAGRAERTTEDEETGQSYEQPVRWGPWRLKMLGGKRLTIARWVRFDKPDKNGKTGSCPEMYVNDVFGLFQMPFAKAIDDIVMDPADRELIIYGKKNLRRVQSRDEGRTVIGGREIGLGEYNVAENLALSRLMSELADGLADPAIGITVPRDSWYGPGPITERWMKTTKTLLRHQLHDVFTSSTEWKFLEACRDSYFGGWFEITGHGNVGRIWNYDINSAYPFIMATLPCLAHAEIVHITDMHELARMERHGREVPSAPAPYTLVRAEMTGKDRHLGAHMHRTKEGNVLRPQETTGLIWWHELAAAVRAGLISTYRVTEAWTMTPKCSCDPPMADIARLYDRRQQIVADTKAENKRRRAEFGNDVEGFYNPQEKGLKLIINSPYGKCAQSVGKPKYANPVYASLITAGCRTMILDAIATHPQKSAAVMMIATDGVYFTSEHPTLNTVQKRSDGAKVLGEWDLSTYEGFTIWRPGIYWHDGARQAARKLLAARAASLPVDEKMIGEAIPKCRGVPRDEAVNLIEFGDRAFDGWTPDRTDDKGFIEWPKFDMKIEFSMTSLTEAIARSVKDESKWAAQAGLVNYEREPVKLSADPVTKRRSPYKDKSGTWRSLPYTRPVLGILSKPYDKPIGLHLIEGGGGGVWDAEPAIELTDEEREGYEEYLKGVGSMEAVEEFSQTLTDGGTNL